MAVDPNSKVYFDTPMLRISDMKYPVYLYDFLAEHTNVSIGSFVWEYAMRDDWGYYKVHDVEIPTGDVVTEGFPVLNPDDDLYYKTWIVRDFTPEEVAANLAAAKQERKNLAYQQFSTDLCNGITVDGEVYVVEPREVINLQTSRAFAVASPAQSVFIRKADFSVVQYTSSDAIAKIDQIIAATGKVQQNLLTYIKALYDTTVITDLPEVPASFLGE